MILGGGPNRIGQGIEFDYCCVHAAMALADEGVESIMVNCNPETVSTDYDTSDRLYFEPLTLEDVLSICDLEQPDGVIVQFGGQTPLKLAVPLERAGVRLLGTSADAIDRAEDRERFGEVLKKLELRAPRWGMARSLDEARRVAAGIGYPVMVRPSYVLGGRAMECVYDARDLERYFGRVTLGTAGLPLLIDQFLPDAVELDVDVVADRTGAVVVGGVMEHIEEAGIHSGDSACALPPYSLPAEIIAEVERQAQALAVRARRGRPDEHPVRGPRRRGLRHRGQPPRVAHRAVRVQGDRRAAGQDRGAGDARPHPRRARRAPGRARAHVRQGVGVSVRRSSTTSTPSLGPEMRSTGEVMGIDQSFASAFAKAQIAAGNRLPERGAAFLSLRDADKSAGAEIARGLADLGFELVATHGTAAYLRTKGLQVRGVNKVREGRPDCVDAMKSGEYSMVVNTTSGAQAVLDSRSLRRSALVCGISYFTTVRAARAAVEAIATQREQGLRVCSLQTYHPRVSPTETPRPRESGEHHG